VAAEPVKARALENAGKAKRVLTKAHSRKERKENGRLLRESLRLRAFAREIFSPASELAEPALSEAKGRPRF